MNLKHWIFSVICINLALIGKQESKMKPKGATHYLRWQIVVLLNKVIFYDL